MRILLCEFKKIWSLKVIGILLLLCAMFYVAFLSFYIEHYPNNHNSSAQLAYSAMLVERYGNTIEPDELEEFWQVLDALIIEADSFIAENPHLAEIGVHDYASLVQMNETLSARYDELTETELEAFETLHSEFYNIPYSNLPTNRKLTASNPEINTVGNNLHAIEGIFARYETVLDPSVLLELGAVPNLPGTNAVRKRHAEMVRSDEYKSIIPNEPIRYTVDYTKNLALLVIIATLLLLSPLLTTDRIRNVHLLQYSSHQGRKIIKKQLAAVLVSSLVLTSGLVLGFGAIYAANGVQFFFESYVSSFNSFFGVSIPLTFGQYVWVLVGLLYLLGLGTALLAFILSRFCSNYIALVAGLIPSAVALSFLSNEVLFQQPLSYFFNETGLRFFEPLVCVVLIALGTAVVVCVVRREGKVDVL